MLTEEITSRICVLRTWASVEVAQYFYSVLPGKVLTDYFATISSLWSHVVTEFIHSLPQKIV
jgi:hypothetical protein